MEVTYRCFQDAAKTAWWPASHNSHVNRPIHTYSGTLEECWAAYTGWILIVEVP